MIELTLPLPPTINHAYGQRKFGGRFLKPAGVKFRQAVCDIVASKNIATMEGRVAIFIAIYPANKRRQDIENRAKALNDALTHAGVWLDDEQIDDLHMIRMPVVKGGMTKVVITDAARHLISEFP